MAERLIRQLFDDLDGKEIEDGFGERFEFSYQGTDYLIDLRPTNADKFEAALRPYLESAAKVGRRRARTEPKNVAAKKVTGSGRSKEQLQAIRDWATNNGYEVAPRGRVKADIIDAFDAAH